MKTRRMEYAGSPAKRRKISKKDKDSFNDGKENLMKVTQIDHVDMEQETNEINSEIVKEESNLDATEAAGCQSMNDDKSCGDNGYSRFEKKLLVLDINGLLVDIVADPDKAYKPDAMIGAKAVFKRPFCDEFLNFCFERFNVGVWTSRTRRNIERVLKFLEIDTQQQLLFCWDQFHCTETGFNTIENNGKPLVLKELKKLWEKQDPDLPWDRGVYNESNTIFLDDSPYKALRNPPYTAIFPYSYSYWNAQDNGLGPDGDLRKYLEKLAASDNVQKYIEQHPFGQQPITEDSESWLFYRKIIGPTNRPSPSRRKLIIIDTGGLLLEVSSRPCPGFRADIMFGSKAVFKRPFCDEFLQFCFKRFNVGIWTSTTRYNTEHTLDFLMGDTQRKLLFCWDRSHCTDTGFSTVENNCKTLFLKEIRRLWDKEDPNLPWEIGEYDESNTLLVETNPSKALINPPHTAIFPYAYSHWNREDNSLGPKGDLRVYLERLAESENVQKFVSENPYGQRPIREKNLSWKYYQKVIHAFSSRNKSRSNGSKDAQWENSSEPKLDTATVLAAPTLLESKTESTTALAAPTLLEPKAESFTVSVAPAAIMEPQTDSTPDAQTSMELETDTKVNSAAVLAAPTMLEPETVTSNSDAQTSMRLETDTTTVLAAPTLFEPEAVSTTVSVAPTLLEPETDTTNSDVHTLVEPETDTTVLAVQTPLEPPTDETAVSAAPN